MSGLEDHVDGDTRGSGWRWPALGVLLAAVILVSGIAIGLQRGSDRGEIDAPIDWSTVDPGDVSSLPDQHSNLAPLVH